MLIVDASALFELLTGSPRAETIRQLMHDAGDLHAPHLIDAEVASVIQSQHARERLDDTAAQQCLHDLALWPATRWAHPPLFERVWELRANLRSYDALYVALAEELAAPLLTCDARLSRAPGPTCEIQLVTTT